MCHALVIEDDPFIAMQVEDVLRAGGAGSVDIAATEDDAVAAAMRHRPDFIASGVQLIEGTGPAAVATILARLGPVPVIFITANPDACSVFHGRAEILTKPVSFTTILQAFRRLVPECQWQTWSAA